MVSALSSSPERAVRVRALTGDAVLCSWARHLTLTVPLSTQEYKWVPANCWGKPNKLPGSDLRWTSIPSRGSRNTPGRFMLQKPGISTGSYGPVGSKASLLSLAQLPTENARVFFRVIFFKKTAFSSLFLLLLPVQCVYKTFFVPYLCPIT